MTDRTNRIEWKPGLLAAALGFLAFGLCLLNDFVYDDHFYVKGNHWIQSWSNLWLLLSDPSTNSEGQAGAAWFWRPLRNLSYLIDYSIAGQRPAWFHGINLLWHCTAVAGLYGLLRRLKASIFVAFVAAALFATHPVQTESVVWIKERDGLMSGCFLLWAFFFALGKGRSGALLSLILASCSFLSKESGLVYVPTLAGLLFYRENGKLCARSWYILSGGLFLSISFVVVRHVVLGGTAQVDEPLGGSRLETIWTMAGVFLRYARLTLIPARLEITYEWIGTTPGTTIFSIMGVMLLVLLVFLAYTYRKRKPLLTLGVFWYMAGLLPFTQFIPMMLWMAGRFLYIPIAGASIAVAAAIEFAAGDRRLGYRDIPLKHAVAGGVILVFAFSSAMETLKWRNDLTLWEKNYNIRASTPRTIAFYAEHLNEFGEYESSLDVLSTFPADNIEFRGLAARARIDALLGLERKEEALLAARRAVDQGVVDTRVLLTLGVLQADAKNFSEAIEAFEMALQRDPFSRDALRNLALLYDGADEHQRAEEMRRRLERINNQPRSEWTP